MALVKHTFKKGDNPPPLTEKMLAEIAMLQTMSDSDIDLSDAPETLDWSNAVRGNYKKLPDNAKNESTNPALLDKDISDWLSQQDHHTKTQVHDMINDLVRHVMDLKTAQ